MTPLMIVHDRCCTFFAYNSLVHISHYHYLGFIAAFKTHFLSVIDIFHPLYACLRSQRITFYLLVNSGLKKTESVKVNEGLK